MFGGRVMSAKKGSRLSRTTLVFTFVSAALLVFTQPVSAGTRTSTIADPEGDAFYNLNSNSQLAAPGYQDILEASVSLRDGRFIFAMGVAAAVPEDPSLPSGAKLLEWSWRVDTNFAASPSGFPWPPGYAAPAEFMVFALWDGTSFTAILIDRTPTLTGGQTIITSVPLKIKGAEITATVDASRMADPSSFLWFASTQFWTADLGTEGFIPLDIALAPGPAWAPWPG